MQFLVSSVLHVDSLTVFVLFAVLMCSSFLLFGTFISEFVPVCKECVQYVKIMPLLRMILAVKPTQQSQRACK